MKEEKEYPIEMWGMAVKATQKLASDMEKEVLAMAKRKRERLKKRYSQFWLPDDVNASGWEEDK